MSPLNAGRLLAVAALSAIGFTAHAQIAITPGELLENYAPGGSAQHSVWTELKSSNDAYDVDASSNVTAWRSAGAYLYPTSGSGELQVLLGGYPASFGIYAFSNDFGLRISQPAGTLSEIESVVVQVEQIGNPDFYEPGVTGLPEDLLFFNDPYASYPTGHAYNATLDGLVSTGRTTYAGGPVLRYKIGAGSVTVLQADPVVAELVNATADPFFGGNWFNYVYQFNLSSLTGVTWVEVSKPFVVHEATTAAKISVGDNYTLLVP